jgi:hypothetical protein
MVGGRVVYSRVCLGVRVGGGPFAIVEWGGGVGGVDSCMGS